VKHDLPVDLHVHTTASDGSDAPEEIVRKAMDKGLEAVAITDHDTTNGIVAAIEAARGTGFEVIPGIEINTDYGEQEVHILGYYVQTSVPEFLDGVRKLAKARARRIAAMVEKLRQVGIRLPLEEVYAIAGTGAVGRLHLAQVLVNREVVATVHEAFQKYLGRGRPGYVPRARFSPVQAVRLIQTGRGVPVLAHPGTIGTDDVIWSLLPCGLQGLEVYHPEHTKDQVRRYLTLAKRLGLIVTGGSDYHRPGYHADLGEVTVPYRVVSVLRKAVEAVY